MAAADGKTYLPIDAYAMFVLVCDVQASINGEVIGEIDSYAGSTFNALGIQGNGVSTLTLTSIDYPTDHWISLIEVGYTHCRRTEGHSVRYKLMLAVDVFLVLHAELKLIAIT